MKKVVNQSTRFFYNPNFGLLLIRVAAGLIFLTHGWSKINNLEATAMMFAGMGFAAPVAYFVSWLEVIGGLALILGIATRVFGILFGIQMLVATFIVGFGRGISIDLVLALVSFGIALTGSGKYSVYKMECKHCGGMLCNGEAGTCTALIR
jgi:putative oxidoreductase